MPRRTDAYYERSWKWAIEVASLGKVNDYLDPQRSFFEPYRNWLNNNRDALISFLEQCYVSNPGDQKSLRQYRDIALVLGVPKDRLAEWSLKRPQGAATETEPTAKRKRPCPSPSPNDNWR